MKTILFVDNLQKFVLTRKEFLEAEGYRVLTASNPPDAKRLLAHHRIDLAVLDIRLTDDSDENDLSGLELANEIQSDLPKIMLTGYPTWELVRASLGHQFQAPAAAVDFVSKREGLEALVRAIEWQLEHPDLRSNLLQTFNVPNLMALPERMQQLGPEDVSALLYKSFEDTSRQLTQFRDQENRRASQYHYWGLAMGIACMILILMGIGLTLFNRLAPTNLSLVGAVVSETASALFFYQQNQAHKRVSFYIERLNELNHLGKLIAICDTLASPLNREEQKMKVIASLVTRWFGS